MYSADIMMFVSRNKCVNQKAQQRFLMILIQLRQLVFGLGLPCRAFRSVRCVKSRVEALLARLEGYFSSPPQAPPPHRPSSLTRAPTARLRAVDASDSEAMPPTSDH